MARSVSRTRLSVVGVASKHGNEIPVMNPSVSSVTAIVATLGRPTLDRALSSVRDAISGAQIVMVPSRSAERQVRTRYADIATIDSVDGLYAAWNAEIQHASTEYVMFINDDDELCGRPVHLEGPDRGDRATIGFLPLQRGFAPVGQQSLTRLLKSNSLAVVDLLRGTRVIINTGIWPRELFDLVGQFDTSYRILGDKEWLLRLAAHDLNIRWLPGPTYRQGRQEGRLSSLAPSNIDLVLEESERISAVILRSDHRGLMDRRAAQLWLLSLRLLAARSRRSRSPTRDVPRDTRDAA